MLRLTARAGLGLAVLFASAATLTRAQPPPSGSPLSGGSASGQPGGASPAAPAILDFHAIDGHWHWLRQEGDQVRLQVGGAHGRSLNLASGRSWTEVAADRESIWLLRREGARGALLKLPRTGGEPTVVLDGLASPAALHVSEQRVFWIETQPAAISGLLYIPAAEPRNMLRTLGADGRPAGLGTMVGGLPPANGDLQGRGPRLYARLRRLGATEFYVSDLGGGPLKRMVAEAGLQNGLAYDGGFVWTAPSEEAADPSSQSSVRHSSGAGVAAGLTDWLPGHGTLLQLGDELYYADLALHRLPGREGEATMVMSLPPGPLVSDGRQLVLLDPRSGPRIVPLNPVRP